MWFLWETIGVFFFKYTSSALQRQGLASPAEASRVNLVYASHSLGLREKLMQSADETGRAEHGPPAALLSHLLLRFALLTARRVLNPIRQGCAAGPWHGDGHQPCTLSPWLQRDADGCTTASQLGSAELGVLLDLPRLWHQRKRNHTSTKATREGMSTRPPCSSGTRSRREPLQKNNPPTTHTHTYFAA